MPEATPPASVEGQPYNLYMAECKDCMDSMQEALKPLKGDYTSAVFCAALLAVLMKNVSIWKRSDSSKAMGYIRRWAEQWERSF